MKEGIEHIYSNVLLLSTAIKNYLNKKSQRYFALLQHQKALCLSRLG